MDRLNFNHLYYFYIVAKEGSIKGAAAKLHVSQPTISDQLKLLETFFDSKLFERRNRSLVLTKKGSLAMDYAQVIFDQGLELTSRLRNDQKIPKRSLDIGITHFMSHYFLYDSLLAVIGRDDIAINVKEMQRHLLLAELEQGYIDILFTDSSDGLPSSISAFRVGVNKTFAIAHKKHIKAQKSFPQCLHSIPFFNYTNETFLKYEIELFFSRNSLSPKSIGQGDDIDLIETVTQSGVAFTIVPEAAMTRICKKNADIIVLGELSDLQTYVWGLKRKNYSGLGDRLLDEMLSKIR